MQKLDPSILHCSFQIVHSRVTSVAVLRATRPPSTKPKHIDQPRIRLFGSALLRFDFICGKILLLAWVILEVCPLPIVLAQRVATKGVPFFVGAFVSHPPELQAGVT